MNNENYTRLLDWWNLQILGFTEATGAIIGQADLPWQGLPAGDPNYEVNIGFTISSSSGDFLPTNFFIAADECIIQMIEPPLLNETSSPEEALGKPILGTTSDDGSSSLKTISSPPNSVTFGGPAPIGDISQPDASPSLLNTLTSTSSLDLIITSSAPPMDGLNPSSLPPTSGVTPPLSITMTIMSPPLFAGLPPEITFHVSPPSSTLDASSMSFTSPALSMSSLPPAYGPS
ncbi:hypothetical protein CEUSTIGMA_g10028.t1 [Chlamydomonas eustigma]|uniref:Uncharacterized protein n=1 Tax=Chlamydomonas eustigma TaxID=1157962 RepID=A0A250XI63_9CHLO|nr:hypothetical protein CEUSTIGMA_g10028.t1 [Chlamydomonas eustigma]|eukprot:GAX82602.1 hypothetical protein CEUSTIGMA_g10028.t1 [Chlamydomonas eustigma]